MKQARFPVWAALLAACWLVAGTAPSVAQPLPAIPAAVAGAGDPAVAPQSDQIPDQDGSTSVWAALELRKLFLEDNQWYHWLTLAGAIVLGWAAGRIVSRVLQGIAGRLQARDRLVRSHVIKDLMGPARLALVALGFTLGLAGLTMADPLQRFCTSTLLLLYSITVFWYAYNLVSVIEVAMRRLAAKTESTLDDQLVPLIRGTLRVALLVMAAIFVVDSVFNQDVLALLAALGVVALPLGIAAQDTLKNVFGALIILFNQPFQVGDRVVYADYDGVIEEIGFQSIRIRTLDGHVVTIPNSKIASDPVKNISKRPFIKRVMNVTITYDTPREKIEQAVEILRGILEEDELREPIHATINGDEYPPRVYFNDYKADSLNILMIYWFVPPAYWDFLEHAQRLHLRIFEEFEKAGIEFAFPTQTLYLAGDPKRELALKTLGGDLPPTH